MLVVEVVDNSSSNSNRGSSSISINNGNGNMTKRNFSIFQSSPIYTAVFVVLPRGAQGTSRSAQISGATCSFALFAFAGITSVEFSYKVTSIIL